jgi:hypothetical protein
MVKYYGRARMRTGAVNTNQISFNLSGTGSSVGARTRYTKKRVCNNLKVCGNVHYQGRIWSNNQKKDGKCGSCLPATTTCPTAGGVGRVNAPRLLCGNYYKNEEPTPTPTPTPTPPTLTLDVTNIQRVLLGNVAQTLGSASVTTSLPSTTGTVYSLVEPIPAGFSINSSTGELSFAGGIAGYGNMNTLPNTVKIKASLNPGDEKHVEIHFGDEDGVYGAGFTTDRDNWDETLKSYWDMGDSILEMIVDPQDTDPTTNSDIKKTRTLCSKIYNNQGQAATINGVTNGMGGLKTRLSSIPDERTIILEGAPRSIDGSDPFFSYTLTNTVGKVDFKLRIAGETQFTLTNNRGNGRIGFGTEGNIDRATGSVIPDSTFDLTLDIAGQSEGGMGRGIFNPYLPPPDTPDAPFRTCVNPSDIYNMFENNFGNDALPGLRGGVEIEYGESAIQNFNYGWVWSVGNRQPSGYLPPLNGEFASIFETCPVAKNCELYPNANNFAVGGCQFFEGGDQNPPQPTLYGGSGDYPYSDQLTIRYFCFNRDDGKTSTPLRIPGRCEFMPPDSSATCSRQYENPLGCSDENLLELLQFRSELPNFNSLIQYILDGAGDDAPRNQGPYQQPDYEIIDVPNGATAIVFSTTFRESQEGVNNEAPQKFYVYLAEVDIDGNPSSTVLNPSSFSPEEQPQTVTTGGSLCQDFMGFTDTSANTPGVKTGSWGEIQVTGSLTSNLGVSAKYSTKNQHSGGETHTTEKGTITFGIGF